MLNALTFDVEEHFQVHNFETVVDRSDWERFPSRVVDNTRCILRLLAEHEVYATFFVLGWVAERHPQLVCEIALAGHEIASHGYWHELIYRQTPEEFSRDVGDSLRAISQALDSLDTAAHDGQIRGYRAPAFSITRDSLWALKALSEMGFQYDSSIFPLATHDRYGLSSANRFAHRTEEGIWEIPVSTVRIAARNLPVGGGGYFRLFPLALTQQGLRRINREGHPAVLYLHPWEFDPDQPRIQVAPLVSRFRHYVNLHRTEGKLRSLLSAFRFAPISQVFAQEFNPV